MGSKIKTLGSKELVKIFDEQLTSVKSYKLINELDNPCHIMFNNIEYYVYIKNLSSAYFKNPDVSRAQLTGIDILGQIKESEALFILMGYDAENDVYATWNPYITKQRIGTASSPSFYSRFSLQEEASQEGNFVLKDLKNEGNVLVFPRHKLGDFMVNISMFFPDTSDYVAMGSKKRHDANTAYKLLNSSKHLEKEFAEYLSSLKLDKKRVSEYVWAIKQLISDSVFSSNRKIFLAYDSVCEYRNVVDIFLTNEYIKSMDSMSGGLFSSAFPQYIEFLIERYGQEIDANSTKIDYETPFIDTHGNLTLITNPKLLDLLRQDLDNEYPRPMAAYATIEDFYGDRFPNMQMHHWQALFKKINWSAPIQELNSIKDNNNPKQKANNKKIVVTFPDGTVICKNKVVNTFLDVINYAGAENVQKLGITMGKIGGNLLISNEMNPKYSRSFKAIGKGLYVNTCSSTETKLSQLNQINKKLELGLKIALL